MSSAPSLRDQDLARRIESIDSLSSPPASLDRVLSLASNAEASAAELASAIELDPAITARVLKLANSAYFGFSRHVETAEEAIMVVGFRSVRNLAACAAVAPVFAGGGAHIDRCSLWRHSCAVAEAGRLIAVQSNQEDGWAYVAGLLHDVGQVVLEELLEEEYGQILEEARADGELVRDERRALGVDHAWAGATLCERWQLSERIAGAIRHHHCPPEEWASAALVGLAERLAQEQGLGEEQEAAGSEASFRALQAALRLSAADLDALRESLAERREAIDLLYRETVAAA